MNGLSLAFFGISALATLLGALFVVISTNPIRSAMALLLAIGGVTCLFIGLDAHFLAAIELIVYAGAVVILFIFVIMLIGPDATPPHDSKALFSRTLAAVVFGVFALVTGFFMMRASGGLHQLPPFRHDFGTIDMFGRELFTRGLVPFELTTALFVVAVVGALAVARGRHKSDATGSSAKEPSP
ncbi:MAG TPA: NADH-quinone oxidoreductase subunit J [Polyangiaceae bacterium]|jgi:NADH-quinone oxidoreductase subunit J|nr:NADH-quinone oxidoreductase subunit J [Polyangiaceae bacterium]